MTMVIPMSSPYRLRARANNAVPDTRRRGVRGSARNRSINGTTIYHHVIFLNECSLKGSWLSAII